jgi:hypothetical protein
MMGICSFFGLSHGLSLLVEVVRMLLMGKKGKTAERWQGSLRRSGGSMPTSAGSDAGVVGCHQLDRSQLAGQVGRFGSLGAPIGAPKARPKWS